MRQGTRLSIAYFDQFRAQLDDEARWPIPSARVRTSSKWQRERKHVISYLGDFLFPPERARSPVKSLSGGERNRLLLARLFARPANVLVLDEPTNDLDIETLELLEELLQNLSRHGVAGVTRPGVSRQCGHPGDRLRRRWHTGWRMPADTTTGSVTLPAARRREQRTQAPLRDPEKSSAPRSRRPLKLSYKEARELEAIPGRIEALEAEQAQLHATVAAPDFHKSTAEEARALQARLEQIERELEGLLRLWEDLENRSGS